jgi:hypothetical protein
MEPDNSNRGSATASMMPRLASVLTTPLVANDYSVWRYRPGVRVEPYNCTLD